MGKQADIELLMDSWKEKHRNKDYKRFIRDGIVCEEQWDREIIKENIEYDSLLLAHPYDQEMVEGIFDLILETVLSKNGEITIAGDVYPKNLVKSKFLKLNYSHVEYVINCLGKNTTKMRNIKSYLLASLFNAGSTISSYYRAEINHDMPQYAG